MLIGLNSTVAISETQVPISQTEILANFRFLFVWEKDNYSSGKRHAAYSRIQVNF